MKMSKLNTVILSLTLLLSIISTVYLYSATPASANSFQPQAAKNPALGPGVFTGVDAPSWYTTFEGVLAVPGEAPLFPFYHGDVEISVSRFGENINPFATSAQTFGGSPVKGVGFQYMDSNGQAYDPIRNAQVDINHVVDGWKLVVTYKSAITSTFRTVWAYALFSDYVMAGSPADGNTPTNGCPNVLGGWILCPYNTPMPTSPTLTPNGGRKTNGFVQTGATPLVLVDTPRRIVVASVNTIYDEVTGKAGDTSTPVARLTLTFDFNKDTKELIIIKDVKILLDIKTADTITAANCEDIAETATIAGAAYRSAYPTAKSQGSGVACFELLDTEELDQAATTATTVAGFAHFFDWRFDEGQFTDKLLTVQSAPFVGDPLYHWDTRAPNNEYDVMQAIDQPNSVQQHITKKAFWPVPDWFTVDAKAQGLFFSKLEGLTQTDLLNPPDVVGTSVQWNFILNLNPPNPADPGADARVQWRSVETLLVTDQHDGSVCQYAGATSTPTTQGVATSNTGEEVFSETIGGTTYTFVDLTTLPGKACFTAGTNIIDKEANYFDQMVFNPWDINQASAKEFVTFVNYFTATVAPAAGATTAMNTFATYIPFDDPASGLKAGDPVLFLNVPDDHTNQFSQWTTALGLPGWDSYGSFAERVLMVTSTGSGVDCSGASGTSNGCAPGGTDTGTPDQLTLLGRTKSDAAPASKDVTHYQLTGCTTRDNSANSCTGFNVNAAPGTIFKIIFSVDVKDANALGTSFGAYEWITVGRDSAVADSAGAAMVTEALAAPSAALTLLAGQDMKDQSAGGVNPTIPFVLQRFTAASPDVKADYTECNSAVAGVGSFLGACPEGARLHLRDDFSTVVPVDGANILVVGGPNANQVANLANDYLSVVFYGGAWYSTGAWDSLSTTGKVFSPAEMECNPTATTNMNLPAGACTFGLAGSALISTYMDVDGTVFFIAYGGNAQDTFWITQYGLQYITSVGIQGGPAFANGESNAASTGMAGNVYCGTTATDYSTNGQVCIDGLPLTAGVTSVIFNIDYTSPHPPSITVFKELNTISEVFPEQDA